MKKTTLLLLSLILLAACRQKPVVVVPTLAVLPTGAPSATLTPTVRLSDTPTLPPPTETFTPLPTETPSPTFTVPPTETLTFTPSLTPSETPTDPPTQTYTPSKTITNTVTPLPSPTFTPSQELDSLGMLALLSQRATILPPELLYNPPTLTAVAYAAQTLVAIGSGLTPAPAATQAPGQPQLATLPPPMTTNCASPLPGGLSGAFAGDPSLSASLGCPQGAVFTPVTAVEAFEHGTMLYVQGSPGSIYVLTLDGRFRRFDDTWVAGVDPETGNETPPLGLLEPKRGFLKVWISNLDVRGGLGWAVTEEQGASSSAQSFDHGHAVFLPQRGETYLLIDDAGGQTGSWRTVAASF